MVADDTLRSIMTKRLIAVSDDDPAIAAVRKMVDNDVGAVLVRRGGKVVGIVTERDILRSARDEAGVLGLKVREITPHRQLITAKPEDSPLHALTLMSENGVRRIPVAEKGKVVGIVTERSIVKWLLERPEQVLDMLTMRYPAVSRDVLVALLRELQLRERI